jgi:hypothetical protein
MGVKVEGVRADERVSLVDPAARKRRRRIVLGGAGVAALALVVVLLMFLGGSPTVYGLSGQHFEVAFTGAPIQSGQLSQPTAFSAAPGVKGVESWRYGDASVSELVEIQQFPSNDPYLVLGKEADNLLAQELAGSHATTIGGLPGVELVTQGTPGSLPGMFAVTETVVLLDPQAQIQYVLIASGPSVSAVSAFVGSFQVVS